MGGLFSTECFFWVAVNFFFYGVVDIETQRGI